MKEIHRSVIKPDLDLMYRQLITAWRKMADELAAAIRQEFDGFPDDEMFLTTTETLEKYDRLVAGTPELIDGDDDSEEAVDPWVQDELDRMD